MDKTGVTYVSIASTPILHVKIDWKMSELRKTAIKSTFFALEPLFFEIFQNRQNRRILYVCSFP